MKHALVWILLVLPQQDVAARLKKEGWRAVADLVEKGEDARGALETAAAGGDSDASFYAMAALAELDCRRDGAFPAVPRTRSLSGEAATVVAGLFQAAGLKTSLEGLPEKKLTIPDGLAFAESIEAATRELNVEFVQTGNPIWRVGGVPGSGSRFASGRVRAVVDDVRYGTSLRPGLPARCMSWVQARMDGYGRFPKPPMYVDLRVLEAVDEHGRNLRPKRDWSDDYVQERDPKDQERNARFHVLLEAPDLTSTKAARLRLALDFGFRKKNEVITFDQVDGAVNVRKKIGDVEAILVRARKEDEDFHVELQLKAPGLESRFSRDEDDFSGNLKIRLLDAAGKAWEEGGSSSGGSPKMDFKMRYRNPGTAGPPATLSFSLVTEVETRSVYFEFRDVPLQ